MDFHKLNFKTRWFPALMNLIGLGIAFSIFLILLSQVWWDFRYDRFKGNEQVYVVEEPGFREGLYDKIIVRPLIPMVKDCSPDVAVVCDYAEERNDKNGSIMLKDPKGEYVDAMGINFAMTETTVLDVFNITLLMGRREDFTNKGDALIAESTARRYFPDRDPMGEVFRYMSTRGYQEGRIVGIYKDRKENESMVNGFLIHEGDVDLSLPNYNIHSCYVKLKPGADRDKVKEAVANLQIGSRYTNFKFVQIHDVWFQRDLERWGVKSGGNKLLCWILTAIAVLFLCIAGFNYVNFAMASLPFQIKDINTRKVFGASRGLLIIRQLCLSFVLVGCAFLIGVLAMRTISGTTLGSFLSWNMSTEKNMPVICIGAVVAIVLSIVTGLVPALYSTSFQPALVLKGSFATSAKGGGLRTATILLQYVLSFIFFICAMVLQRQTSYMVNNRELGFDYDLVLKMESTLFSPVEEVEARIRDIPGVKDITLGSSPIRESLGSMSEIREADNVVKYSFRSIPSDYLEFFHFQLAEGRFPQLNESGVALVNEAFVDALPSYGIGKLVKDQLGEYTIVGILKNFHARSLENDFAPLVFCVGNYKYSNSFLIRIEPQADASVILEKARSIYSEMKGIPEDQIETGFLNKDIEKLYEHEIRQTRLIRMSSFLSLIITLIGILGVVWLDTRFMRKEIAIRKVNGAMKREILKQVIWKYLIIAVAGFVIATPIAIAICQRWLQHFAFRTNMPVWLFLLAFATIIGITLITVMLQAWRAASANPVESLKNE